GCECSESDFNQAVSDTIHALEQFVNDQATVCILVHDYTRATPTSALLSFLLPALEAKGIKKENVFFLFASGSHRLMNEKQKRARLSDYVYENYHSMDHLFFDKSHLVKKGNFDDGAPIYINKYALEADIRIAVGTL